MIALLTLDERHCGLEDLLHGLGVLDRGRERVAADEVGDDRRMAGFDPRDRRGRCKQVDVLNRCDLAVVGGDSELLEYRGGL